MYKEEFHIDRSKGNELRLPCSSCHGNTWHKVLSSVDVEKTVDRTETDEPLTGYLKIYQIVRCQGCRDVSFRKNEINSNEANITDDGEWDPIDDVPRSSIDHEQLYPSRISGRRRLEQSHLLPANISRIYDEINSAMSNRLPLLAGIGIRVIIEAICKERQSRGRTLEEKIDNLQQLGLITRSDLDVLHRMRILGNEAAHDTKLYSEVTLITAINIVEHLLLRLYILPREAQILP